MSGPESKFAKELDKRLREIPDSWFFNAQLKSLRGIPDRVGLIRGRFVALEIKADKSGSTKMTGRTVLQRIRIQTINKCGGYACFVYPENAGLVISDLIGIAGGRA